jgi:ankyrin repeat protein
MEAAERSDSKALRILLSHGATLGPEILFHAIGLRQNFNGTATMEALIEYGADINCFSSRRSTPLIAAVRIGDEDKIRFLLARGADPNLKASDDHLSALSYARRLGRMHLVSLMEAAGGDIAP